MSERHSALGFVAFAALALLSACATFRNAPAVGEPGPAACFAATQAEEAWVKMLEPYIRAMLEAQRTHSCQPVPLAPQVEPPQVQSAP